VATAIALELMRISPAVGVGYIIVAIGIMLGAFLGRYHYAADVVLGAAVALVAFFSVKV